jgi:hypothetical protein
LVLRNSSYLCAFQHLVQQVRPPVWCTVLRGLPACSCATNTAQQSGRDRWFAAALCRVRPPGLRVVCEWFRTGTLWCYGHATRLRARMLWCAVRLRETHRPALPHLDCCLRAVCVWFRTGTLCCCGHATRLRARMLRFAVRLRETHHPAQPHLDCCPRGVRVVQNWPSVAHCVAAGMQSGCVRACCGVLYAC